MAHDNERPSQVVDARTEIRKLLDGLPGEPSRSACGCLWKRVKDLQVGDVVISGDVVVGLCEQHDWESQQPSEVVRRLNQQRREIAGGKSRMS